MNRLLLTLASCLLLSAAAWSHPVNYQQALELARLHTAQKAPHAQLRLADGDAAQARYAGSGSDDRLIYLFNIGSGQGFVVISGDDQTEPVLAYADSGSLDYDRMPDNARAWLDFYAQQISRLRQGQGAAANFRAAHAKVDQMLTSQWNQNAPYNDQCPNFFTYGKSVTGCVATAMAQVLYFHRDKAVNTIQTEIEAYDCDRNWSGLGRVHVDAVPEGSVIDWDNMIDVYGPSATTAQKKAVADLMRYCGASVRMDYANNANGGSAAYTLKIPTAAKKYFGFSADAAIKYHDTMTDSEWDQMIYDELAAHRPVIIGAQTKEGNGHAFVCDGFDGSGMYHINWGWGGLADGYYLLSSLDVESAGIGGVKGAYDFEQDAVIGMEPGDGTPFVEQIRLTTTKMCLWYDGDELQQKTLSKDYYVPFGYKYEIHNYTSDTHNFNRALALYKDGDMLQLLAGTETTTNNFINSIYYTPYGQTYLLGDLPEGTYQVIPVSREDGSDTWLQNEGSEKFFYTVVFGTDKVEICVGKPETDEPEPEPEPMVYVTVKDCSRLYGEANPTFDYEVTGGELKGTPIITCEATPESPVGTYLINIANGSVSNSQVTFTGGTLTVSKAPLNVKARSYSRLQGEENPALEVDYDGFRNSDTEAVLTQKPIATTTATAASEPGEYPITVSGGEAQNYELSYTSGTLTVTAPEPITLTARSYTREYGEENPALEYDYEGTGLIGEPELTCDATTDSPVGTYPIRITQGTVGNLNVTYVDGTLTIMPATLTATARSYTRKQGEDNPEMEVDYEGFKLDETTDVLITPAQATCEATPASEPGEYPITLSGGEAQNYVLDYVAGTLTVTPADPLTLTAVSLTREYGEPNPELQFTAEGAPLTGQPELTCDATPDSPVGTYPIRIAQGTVENYNVTYVDGTLTVTPAPLTVMPRNYSRKQGEPNPIFECDYEGFKLDETADVLTQKPTVTTSALPESAPGSYPIVASGAQAQNYDISYAVGTLTVVEADPLTLTAVSLTREYGDENPTLQFTAEGATLTGQPELTCDATAESPVGTYPIRIAQGTVGNYNVTYVEGTLTVTQAPLKATARSYIRKQGEDNPTFEIDYEGFKLGQDASVLSEQPQASCEATPASEPGQYLISLSGGQAQNYELTLVGGTLEVIPADLIVVTALSYNREYGEQNPQFSFVADGGELSGQPEITCEATPESPAGTYRISIAQGSVTNYNVHYVAGTLTINKAPLTITARSYTRKQGEDNPTLEMDYEGFKLGETADVLDKQPQATCEATPASEPGEYPITLSGGEAQNYELTLVSGTLTVVEADPLTLTAVSLTREYGEPNPDLSFTAEGAPLTGQPELSCDATPESPVGTYPIRIAQGTVENYNVTYVEGTLTVTKAMLLVSVADTVREEGQDNPDFTIAIEGFKLGQDASVLSQQPQASCEATAESPVGQYVIVVAGGEAQNYEFTYVNGTLTIVPSTAIAQIVGSDQPFDVYDLKGRLVARQVSSLKGLPRGVFVVKAAGRSVKVKR